MSRDARRHRVHGLEIDSTLALPIPSHPPTAAADVHVGVADRTEPKRASEVSRQDHPDAPSIIERWTSDGIVIEFPGSAVFTVSERSVLLTADHTPDRALVAHLVLDQVLPRVVALRGDLMLHASGAVGPDGAARIFVGATGSGKSTLATALALSGWQLLDDDGIRVVFESGRPMAIPGYSGMRLWPDAARALLPEVASDGPMYDGHPKHRFSPTGAGVHMATDAAPIAAIYVLEPDDGNAWQFERLSLGDSLRVLTANGIHVAPRRTEIARQAFEHVTDVAAKAQVFRLRRPDGFDRYAELAAVLTDSTQGHA